MGCDIDTVIEVRVGGKWCSVYHLGDETKDEPVETTSEWEARNQWGIPENKGAGVFARLMTEEEREVERSARLPEYGGRDYALFGLLGNVRNKLGVKPIAMPRGVPDDSPRKGKHHGWDEHDENHSHTWFTLAELLAFSWSTVPVFDDALAGYGANHYYQKREHLDAARAEYATHQDFIDGEFADYLDALKDKLRAAPEDIRILMSWDQ